MNALILDGTRPGDIRLVRACDAAESALRRAGSHVERLRLREMNIAQCCGGFDCWEKTPGRCATKDDGRRMGPAMMAADLLLIVTPVSFGGYGSLVKSALDRVIPALLPFFETYRGEVHHPLRGGRAKRLAVLGGLPGPDHETEGVLRRIAGRNALNMRSPSHAVEIVHDSDDDASAERGARDLLRAVGVAGAEVDG